MNGRKPKPLSKRQTLQVMVILTILAWATTTLLHQWGYGQDAATLTISPEMTSGDKFVTGGASGFGGTLELRGEATITGGSVSLRQICRWSDADALVFKSVEDLTIAHISDTTAFQTISVEDLRKVLHDAGVNVAIINFAGEANCTVARGDARVDESTALKNWIDARQNPTSATLANEEAAPLPATRPVIEQVTAAVPVAAATAEPAAEVDVAPAPAARRLRDLLAADVCQRLGIVPETIQMTFSPEDDRVLSLAEPLFKFDIKPLRVRGLGAVSWDVTIVTETGNREVTISAVARAWEDQVTVAKPIAYKEILQEADFTTRHVLVDELPDLPLIRLDQCVGQQAAADLQIGTIMVARLVDPVPLVRGGQLVTVVLTEGSVQIKTVGRALEPGTMGQTIKVRNEATRDTFDVTVTGPQEGRLSGSATE
jgi:flagella basal body P-ring formation protein FlgA